jgi:hypothetical protein
MLREFLNNIDSITTKGQNFNLNIKNGFAVISFHTGDHEYSIQPLIINPKDTDNAEELIREHYETHSSDLAEMDKFLGRKVKQEKETIQNEILNEKGIEFEDDLF